MIRRGPKGVLVFSKKALFSFYLFASFFPERLHDHTHLYYQWPFTTGAATVLLVSDFKINLITRMLTFGSQI